MFSIQQLKSFVVTVEQGSMTKAAKALFISQPALTKQLTLLEKELQQVLFLRKSSGVELTSAGQFFYRRAIKLIEQAEALFGDMKDFKQTHLKVGALPSIGSYYLPGLFNTVEQFQDYKIEIVIKDTTDELIELLKNELVDFAFVQDLKREAKLSSRHLFHERYVALIPINDRLSQNKEVTMAELTTRELLLHKDPCDIRTSFKQYCDKRNLSPSIQMELDYNESIISFVAKGHGVSMVPNMVAENIFDKMVAVKELDQGQFKRSIDCIFQPRIKYLVDIISDRKDLLNEAPSLS